jgi:hypothetical protein
MGPSRCIEISHVMQGKYLGQSIYSIYKLPPADALFLFWLIVRAPVLVQVHGTGRWELIVHGQLGH